MIENYLLMHKDVPCGLVGIDDASGSLIHFKVYEKEYVPFLGTADSDKMKLWWMSRAVPGSRKMMQDRIRRAGCVSGKDYLAKNLALSLTDSYWIAPIDMNLKWDDVKLYGICEDDERIIPYHKGASYDPNASLGGEMDKHWDTSTLPPRLKKMATTAFGQQSINEAFATMVHNRQHAGIEYVDYIASRIEGEGVVAECEAFTSEQVEFIGAYEVLFSEEQDSGISQYDLYIDICEKLGLDRDMITRCIDYQILSDFAITNIDKHFYNFGLLRNVDTLEIIGPAPIFDSGNSMFYNFSHIGADPIDREELLKIKISSFHSSEDKLLSHVVDKDIISIDLLPSENEVREFYMDYGVPEDRSSYISGSYSNKVEMLDDFQRNKTISLNIKRHR